MLLYVTFIGYTPKITQTASPSLEALTGMAEIDDEVIWKQWDPLSNVTETFCDRQYLDGGIPKCLFLSVLETLIIYFPTFIMAAEMVFFYYI